MRLNHFTCWNHFLEIVVVTGAITTTESNIGSGRPDWQPFGEHVGPDVVWLTSHDEASGHGLENVFRSHPNFPIETDKTRVRITVDLPDNELQRWGTFSKQYRMHPKWRRVIEHNMRHSSWWVLERPVRPEEIVDAYVERTLAETLNLEIGPNLGIGPMQRIPIQLTRTESGQTSS